MIVEKARQCGKVSQLVQVARNTSSVAESVVTFVMEEKKSIQSLNCRQFYNIELQRNNKQCQLHIRHKRKVNSYHCVNLGVFNFITLHCI